MTLSLEDAERLRGATVLDAKGEEIGAVGALHGHEGVLTGVHVELDDAIATLPEVARDELVFSPDYLEPTQGGEVRLKMELMDAVEGHAPPGGPEERMGERLGGGEG